MLPCQALPTKAVWRAGRFLTLHFAVIDCKDFRLHIASIRLHDLNLLTYREFIFLFQPDETVLYLVCNTKIRIIFQIGIVIVNLRLFIRLSEEEACCKFAVGTVCDLLFVPVHMFLVKLRALLIVIDRFPVGPCTVAT